MIAITQNHIAEGAALIASLLFWPSLKRGKLKSLPLFLAFILLIELAGTYIREKHANNVWLYNLSIPIEYSYYLFLFWRHGDRRLKKTVQLSWILFSGICICHFIALDINRFYSYMLVSGQILVILNACFYIYQLFMSPGEISLWKQYFFWLVSGLFLFNLGDMAYFILSPFIYQHKWDQLNFWFRIINNNLLLVLYLSYIISILIFKKYSFQENA